MENQVGQNWQGSRTSRGARSNPGLSPHQRPQRRFDGMVNLCAPLASSLKVSESWVEVSSQPSSSSLSSIGDDIVTTGLRVANPYARRRRLHTPARSLPQQQTAVHSVAGDLSSQEEYDESESDDDRLLTSSTENARPEEVEEDSDADSDGDNVTALGRRTDDQPVFQPQPNAFSHPPRNLAQRRESAPAISAIPSPHPHSGFTRPSFTQRPQTQPHHAGPSFMSPSVREENDAALRASLTTLLSCAHAARGLPKSKEEAEAQRVASAGVGPSSQPMELRFIPESELQGESQQAERPRQTAPSPPLKRGSRTRSLSRIDACSEKSRQSAGSSTASRATKKKKTAPTEDTYISPTLLTWVVSAGVVVLVSVVGFGAGYVIGREVGKQEALVASVGSVNETTSCGQEVIRSSGSGLRRLRWGAAAKSIVA